jgi:hypothetical protein
LNFSNAMQMTLGTNVQAGSSGAAATSTGTVPTLSAAGAGRQLKTCSTPGLLWPPQFTQ